ncbi:hypothetical protein ASD50_03665 [Mesorhizobium sp. Root552]|jgi:DNA invertase Pin-like site-specific DNA recombinase|uniref:recombinase family protein n=1 Tax=Mesorhizobium sp. Root552 TaxID=1736555 RepID=UPI000701CEB0|nr:recombinase family protein [Mesorhizobium sp. Root552]KQZ26516.1 hypothetical protein ASD50_03665 [Mesorhizobium sp. Root552]
MKIGYARVSTDEQNLDMQLQALKAAGCDRIYEDRGVSGAATTRPGLRRAMKALRAGDVLIVWRLDRLGRSLPHLIDIIAGLNGKEVGLQSLREQIDTTSPAGRFYLHMLAALAEFERELIRDRTIAGMAAARIRGVRLGRPRKLSPQQVKSARKQIANGEKLAVAAESLGVSGLTLRRALAE